MSSSIFGQDDRPNSTKEAPSLELYADSLKHLLLAHQTTKTLYLTDSLLEIHHNEISPEIIRIKAARANAYELVYNFESALEIYNDLIVTLESHEFVEAEIDVYLSLARVYESVNKPEHCKSSLTRALELIETYDKPQKLSRFYVRSASYQRIYNDRELGREYALKGVELGRQDKIARSVADGSLLLGILSENFEESIGHFKRASRGFFELGDFIGSNFQDLNVARKYTRNGDYKEALSIIEGVKEFSETIDDNDRVYFQFKIRTAELSEIIYSAQGQKDSVITALRQKQEYSELLGNLINQERIDQLVFDNIIRQEQEKSRYARNLNKFLGIGIFFLLGISGFLFALYIKNRKQHHEIQEQAETIKTQYEKSKQLYKYQTTLLSEVHHRIKNNLQLIISLLTLQKAKSSNAKESDMLDMLNHRVSSISLIHEQLYNSKKFDKLDVNQYAKDLLNNFNSLLAERNVIIEYQIENIELNLETITPLGLIWSELISNSLKYNKDKSDLKIFFNLTNQDQVYHMHYYDNGRGYPNGNFESNKNGMGHIIVKSLSQQLKAEVKSYNDDGAHYVMRLKEKVVSPL